MKYENNTIKKTTLEIDICNKCPFMRCKCKINTDNMFDMFCKAGQNRKDIVATENQKNDIEIPKWCPLEDEI